MQQLKGVSISQGLAVGKIVVLTSAAAPEAQAGTPEEELARFQRAQQQAVRDLGALYEKARAELGEAEAEIFSVHQLMAEDEDFTDLITAAIADGAEASEAVRQAGEQCAAMFSSMDDAYMRERAADVQDVAASCAAKRRRRWMAPASLPPKSSRPARPCSSRAHSCRAS